MPGRLEDLDARLKAAKPPQEAEADDKDRAAMGMAMRVGVEIVVALAVGLGLGWLAAEYAGAGRWAIAVGGLVGGLAGILNAVRAAMGFGATVGYRRAGDAAEEKTKDETEDGHGP